VRYAINSLRHFRTNINKALTHEQLLHSLKSHVRNRSAKDDDFLRNTFIEQRDVCETRRHVTGSDVTLRDNLIRPVGGGREPRSRRKSINQWDGSIWLITGRTNWSAGVTEHIGWTNVAAALGVSISRWTADATTDANVWHVRRPEKA